MGNTGSAEIKIFAIGEETVNLKIKWNMSDDVKKAILAKIVSYINESTSENFTIEVDFKNYVFNVDIIDNIRSMYSSLELNRNVNITIKMKNDEDSWFAADAIKKELSSACLKRADFCVKFAFPKPLLK